MIIESMESAFDLARAGSDALKALIAPTRLTTSDVWMAQRDLMEYLFGQATNAQEPDGVDPTKSEWQQVANTYDQVLSFNDNNGQPSPDPADADYKSLGSQHLVLFCNFDRFREDMNAKGQQDSGYAWDTATDSRVEMDEQWQSCKSGTGPGVRCSASRKDVYGVLTLI